MLHVYNSLRLYDESYACVRDATERLLREYCIIWVVFVRSRTEFVRTDPPPDDSLPSEALGLRAGMTRHRVLPNFGTGEDFSGSDVHTQLTRARVAERTRRSA